MLTFWLGEIEAGHMTAEQCLLAAGDRPQLAELLKLAMQIGDAGTVRPDPGFRARLRSRIQDLPRRRPG